MIEQSTANEGHAETRTRALRVAVEEAAGKTESSVVERLLESLRRLHRAEDGIRRARAELRDLADDLETRRQDKTLTRRSADLVKTLENTFADLAQQREALLTLIDRHVPAEKRDGLKAAVVPTPDPAGEAIHALLREFRDGFVGRLAGTRVLTKGVRGVSPKVLVAAAAIYEQPHCSVDPAGAANVEHMVSVFECALRERRSDDKKALAAATVDAVFLETIATDIRGKGRSPKELADFALVPMVTLKGRAVGRTGAELWSHAMVRDLMHHWPRGAAKSGGVKRALVRSIQARVKPSGDDIKQDLAEGRKAGKVSADDAKQARRIWRAAMEKAPFPTSLYQRDFQAGTLLHGLGNLDDIFAMVLRAGGTKADARRVSECQLGHHMAGFVAYGFSEIDAIPDFDALATEGLIRPSSAPKLDRLYREAIALASQWRPRIDEASRRNDAPSLTYQERAELAHDAAELRKAIRSLPKVIRWQLTSDDAGQFTTVGISKWLKMFWKMPPAPTTMGGLIGAVYARAHQPYKEENEARGSGSPFAEGSAVAAHRLGMTLVDDGLDLEPAVLVGGGSKKSRGHALAAIRTLAPAVPEAELIDWYGRRPASYFREAFPEEPAFAALANRLRHDVHARSRYREEVGDGRVSDDAIVDWFRNSAPDPAFATRIAKAEDT